MIESYQQIIWEAVFRNPSLDALDMRMAEEPMCRAQEGREPWKKIEESLMKTTGESGMDSNYR